MENARNLKRSNERGSRLPSWVWFLSGFLAGVSLCVVLFFDIDLPGLQSPAPAEAVKPGAPSQDETAKLDFYEILPKHEVPVDDYAAGGGKAAAPSTPAAFILQIGSFPDPADADALRARVLLLGLDAYVKQSDVKGQQWHRVLVGPLDSEPLLVRARNTLAEAGLQAVPLRVQP